MIGFRYIGPNALISYSSDSEEFELHRTDGPAIEFSDGMRKWYYNNLLHRADGPAIEYADGSKEWWFKGRRHRIDGPAIIATAPDHTEWWIHGRKI